MWSPFVFKDNNYLLRIVEGNGDVEVQLTDLKGIWRETTTSDSIIERFKEYNPLFDVESLSSEEILQKIKSLANINSDTEIELEKNESNNILDLKCKVMQFSIRIKFFLTIADENIYFNQIVIPLIQSVKYLEMQQKRLCDLLEKKDKEIQEHVLENGNISRKRLVTKKFNRVMNQNVPTQLFLGVFETSKEFQETFASKYGDIILSSKRKLDSSTETKIKQPKLEGASDC